MDETTRSEGVIIASVFLFLVVLVLPIYVYIVKLFLERSEYKKHTAFWIMANIGIIDCMFLIAIFQACLMTLTQSPIMPLLYESCSAVHVVYEWVLNLLDLILAVNRIAMILKPKFKFMDVVFKALTIFVWLTVIAVLNFFASYKLKMVYYYDDNSFSVNLAQTLPGGRAIYSIYYYCDFSTVIATFCCYIFIIFLIVLEKCKFRNSIKIESHEIRIFFQGLVTFVPGTCYWILNVAADWNFREASMVLNTVFTVLPRLVPIVNVCGYLVLNSHVRHCLKTLVQKLICKNSVAVETSKSASDHMTIMVMRNA